VPRRIVTFVQGQGHHVKALLRAHFRRRGHMQVTCLLKYQKRRRGDHYTCRGEAVGDAYTFLTMSKLISLRSASSSPLFGKTCGEDLAGVRGRSWMRLGAPSLLLLRRQLRSDGRCSLGEEQQSRSAASWVTEQPYSGSTLLISTKGRAWKRWPKNCLFHCSPERYTATVSASLPAVDNGSN